MFAIIKLNNKEYKVTIGDLIKTEKLKLPIGSFLSINEILLLADLNKTILGSPYIKGYKITAEVVSHHKSNKIIIFKKRRRKHSKRTYGYREQNSILIIKSIDSINI